MKNDTPISTDSAYVDPILLCPVCSNPLIHEPKRLICTTGHGFDLSTKGHAHLLPGSSQGVSGDSAEMVRARRRFLQAAYYEALQKKLATSAVSALQQGGLQAQTGPYLLDAGCGEGYYTTALAEAVLNSFPSASCYGTDISKDAVRLSAGRCKSAFFFVASVFHLPIHENKLDLITVVFAPDACHEFRRILKPGGYLIVVTPGTKHLHELKQVLYEQVIDNPPMDIQPIGFECICQDHVDLEVSITGIDKETGIPHLHDLLAMTPYYWKTPADGVARLKTLDKLTTKLSFCISTYRKS